MTPEEMTGIDIGIVEIRKAVDNDVSAIVSMINEHKFSSGSGSLLAVDEETVKSRIEDGNFFVAYAGGNFAGCASLVEYGIAELRSLVVNPEYRGQGIGGKLIKAVKQHALDKGYEKLYALTQDNAYSAFQKQGFHKTEVPP